MTGITSEERSRSTWPTRGPDFNSWHEGIAAFADLIQRNPGLWLADSDLKYLNIRVDTRSGHFLVSSRDGDAISADRVADACSKASREGMNGEPAAEKGKADHG